MSNKPISHTQLAIAINKYAEKAIEVGFPAAYQSKEYGEVDKMLQSIFPDRLPIGWQR